MALDTFDNLKAAIINMSGRDDLSASIDDFITLAEDLLYNNDVQPLRLLSMVSAPNISSLSGRFLDLPLDFIEVKQFRIEVGGESIELKSAIDGTLIIRSGTGRPNFYVVGDKIQFDIEPDQDYTVELIYMAKPTPLSSDNETNDVLTNHPSLYLYGALTSLNDFAAEEDKAEYYKSKMLSGIRGANKVTTKARLGSSPAIRQRVGTP